jgi:hypothetical protein
VSADLATFRALSLDVYPEHPGKTVFLLAFIIQVFYHFLEDCAERYFLPFSQAGVDHVHTI